MSIHNSRLFALLSVEIEKTLSWVMIFSYAAVFARYFTRGVSIPFPSFSRYLYQNWAGLIPVLMTFTLWFTDKFIVNLFKIPVLNTGFQGPYNQYPNFSVFLLRIKKV